MFKPIAKEIREQILFRIKNEGVPVAQAAQAAGVGSQTVYGWLSQEAVKAPSVLEVNRLKRENEGLYQLIGKITSELSKLKKGNLLK